MSNYSRTIVELFRPLLRLRRYKPKTAEVGIFRKVGHFSANFRRNGASPANPCWC